MSIAKTFTRTFNTTTSNYTYFRQVFLNNIKYQFDFLVRRRIIKIQDQEDFNKHVLNSKEPVVIDFFATYVSLLLSLYKK